MAKGPSVHGDCSTCCAGVGGAVRAGRLPARPDLLDHLVRRVLDRCRHRGARGYRRWPAACSSRRAVRWRSTRRSGQRIVTLVVVLRSPGWATSPASSFGDRIRARIAATPFGPAGRRRRRGDLGDHDAGAGLAVRARAGLCAGAHAGPADPSQPWCCRPSTGWCRSQRTAGGGRAAARGAAARPAGGVRPVRHPARPRRWPPPDPEHGGTGHQGRGRLDRQDQRGRAVLQPVHRRQRVRLCPELGDHQRARAGRGAQPPGQRAGRWQPLAARVVLYDSDRDIAVLAVPGLNRGPLSADRSGGQRLVRGGGRLPGERSVHRGAGPDRRADLG